jgi:hypothetical protein
MDCMSSQKRSTLIYANLESILKGMEPRGILEAHNFFVVSRAYDRISTKVVINHFKLKGL